MGYFIKQAHETAPVIITMDRAKLQLKIETDFIEENDIIQDGIDAAIEDAENYTNTHITEAIFTLNNSCFVQDMPLTKSPIQAIEKIEYYDADNIKRILDAAEYSLIPVDEYQHKIVFKNDFPDVYQTRSDAVIITIKCGYASDKTPKTIKSAVLMMMTAFYENREDHVYKLPTRAMSLLRKYRFHL